MAEKSYSSLTLASRIGGAEEIVKIRVFEHLGGVVGNRASAVSESFLRLATAYLTRRSCEGRGLFSH
jgi:hypothetical protein